MHDIFDVQAATYGWKFINGKLPQAIANRLAKGSIRTVHDLQETITHRLHHQHVEQRPTVYQENPHAHGIQESTHTDLLKPATAATGGRGKKAGFCVKLWLAGIYFLVHAIFVASKLWIWQQFKFLAGQRASLY